MAFRMCCPWPCSGYELCRRTWVFFEGGGERDDDFSSCVDRGDPTPDDAGVSSMETWNCGRMFGNDDVCRAGWVGDFWCRGGVRVDCGVCECGGVRVGRGGVCNRGGVCERCWCCCCWCWCWGLSLASLDGMFRLSSGIVCDRERFQSVLGSPRRDNRRCKLTLVLILHTRLPRSGLVGVE